MSKNNYVVKIGDWKTKEIHSESHDHNIESATAMLWACANQSTPEYAEANIGDFRTPVSNLHMRGKEPLTEQYTQQRDKLNKVAIESLVQEALNGIYDELKKHGDNPSYVDIITHSSNEWAKECYQ
jgi:hypothetical protein